MKPEKLAAIEKAAAAVMNGKYHEQFIVDWYHGGAGTSTNMNANEVLANVALELTGRPKGDYSVVEPHDDLNMSQSTNDSYPTALASTCSQDRVTWTGLWLRTGPTRWRKPRSSST
jgi:aspartate ammonia-lyase